MPARPAGALRTGVLARDARVLTAVGMLLMLLVMTSGRPWELLAEGQYTSDFYDAQAQALWQGRWDVPADVAVIEGFEIGGRTFLYFGPFPALLRMPFSWIPGNSGRLTVVMILAGYAVASAAAFRIVSLARPLWRRSAARRTESEEPRRLRTAVGMGALLSSPLLFLGSEVTAYNEAVMWGVATALLTYALVLSAWRRPSAFTVCGAVLSATACALTRISVALGAVLAVLMLSVVLWRRGRHREAGWTAVGALAAVAAHAVVNNLKFGSWWRIPFERQMLTLADPRRAEWLEGTGNSYFRWDFLPSTLVHYLRPDAVRPDRLLPFVRFGPRASSVGPYPLERADASASLTTSALVLTVLAVVGLVGLVLHRRRRWLALTAAAVVGAMPALLIGAVAYRYMVDLLPALVVPAAAGVWVPLTPRSRSVIPRVLLAGCLVTAWVNLGLAWWIQNYRDAWFTDLRYRLDAALFGSDDPPSVVRWEDSPVARDGLVMIAGDCDALYIGDGDRWHVLERPVGAFRARLDLGTVPRSVTVVRGDGWHLRLIREEDTVRPVIRSDGRTVARGERVPVEGGAAVDVVNDPVTGETRVRVGSTDALIAVGLGLDSPVRPVRGAGIGVPDTSLCERLDR